MYGVLINGLGIIVGGLVGLLVKKWLTKEISSRLELALGVATILIGIKLGLRFENVMLLLICLLAGGVLGTLLELEKNMERFAQSLEQRWAKGAQGKFAKGFTTCTILFCTGAMAVIGPIQSAIAQDHSILYTKAILDGCFSMALAGLYGVGVVFSFVPVVLYQGLIALGANQLDVLKDPRALSELSGIGGLLILMIGLSVAGIKKMPVADFIPAVFISMFALAMGWA